MATFSQFKSKYITERRSKNIGDEGTKNIVKKLLGKDAIPDDGGKAGQARIEKELELNKNNTTTNRRGRRVINKKYTPPDKVTSQNIQTKSIVNQANKVKDNLRTVDKTINTNVVKGSGEGVSGSKGDTTVKPNTNTVTNTKKTVDVKGKIDQALKDYQSKLKAKNVVWGMGHREYSVKDPRANILTDMVQELFDEREGGVTDIFEKAIELEKACEEKLSHKGVYPNVDFYSGILYKEMDIPTDIFTPIFAMSRVSGWLAHWIEQIQDNKIFRPTQNYVGSDDRAYIDISDR